MLCKNCVSKYQCSLYEAGICPYYDKPDKAYRKKFRSKSQKINYLIPKEFKDLLR